MLGKVASGVVEAVAASHPGVPVTGKIRIGWDDKTINAPQVARILEDCGIRRLAVHGRTRAQGYSGVGELGRDRRKRLRPVSKIPVIGNGDIATARDDVKHRRDTAGVAGVMIGRAAMGAPWLFAQAKAFLATGEIVPDPTPGERWEMVRKHCARAVAVRRRGGERAAMASMRARLMAYTRGMDGGRMLRGQLSHVTSLMELDDIAARHLEAHASGALTATAA